MMKKVLVAFSTNSGSTEMVAQVIGETLKGSETETEVKHISTVSDISGYSAVVLGGPMILGWHRKARSFFRKYRDGLSRVPTALFFTSMEVTRDQDEGIDFPVFVDPKVLKEPSKPGSLSFKERHTTLKSYFKPILKLCSVVKPAGAAFFAGKLDYRELKMPHMLFAMLIIQAKPGDFRNRETIEQWTQSIKPLLIQ